MHKRISAVYSILLVVCYFFCTGCGIEKIIYLHAPRKIHYNSHLDDKDKRYCEFETADGTNTADVGTYFRGTEIYYRIYAYENECTADIQTIYDYNDKNPSASARYLIDTKKYHYLTVDSLAANERPLLAAASSNRIIRFRLQDYDSTDNAALRMRNSGTSGLGSVIGVPRRSNVIPAVKRQFQGSTIQLGDSDVAETSATAAHDFWYVNFYAVSYGWDDGFRNLYSALEPLGYIKIEVTS
ncbi:MAG: hypothetical protein ACTTH8_07930 [Treponema sp.]